MPLFEIEKGIDSVEIYDENKKISITVTQDGEVASIHLAEPQRSEFIRKIKELHND